MHVWKRNNIPASSPQEVWQKWSVIQAKEKRITEAAQCGMGSQPYATHLSGDACFVVLTSVKEIIQRTTSAVQQLILSTEVLTNCLEFFNLLNADGLLFPDGRLVNMALNPY